jgi:hypothetical protein
MQVADPIQEEENRENPNESENESSGLNAQATENLVGQNTQNVPVDL